ncbi:Ras-related protein Rap-1 [Diplonema papillatum]|nr:Ras-related protein Rap-1 [Diplonema papillatum]
MSQCKLVVLGDGGVGKSAISVKFVQDIFVLVYDPSISDVYKKQETIDGETVILEVVDTAGQEEYAAMRAPHYQKGEGFIAVYSIADRGSFQSVEQLRDDVMRERGGEPAPMVLVGNKCDVESQRKVSKKEGETLAANWYKDAGRSVPFFETSAKEGTNIAAVFHQIVREVRKFKEGPSPPQPAPAASTAAAEVTQQQPPPPTTPTPESSARAAEPPTKPAPKPAPKGAKGKVKGKKDKKDKKKICLLM